MRKKLDYKTLLLKLMRTFNRITLTGSPLPSSIKKIILFNGPMSTLTSNILVDVKYSGAHAQSREKTRGRRIKKSGCSS